MDPTLFSTQRPEPLPARMRPRDLDEVTGQGHLLAPGRPLGDAIRSGAVGSLILTGPPGTGKTSIAMLVGRYTNQHVVTLNAVTDGIPRLREVVEEAAMLAGYEGRGTVVLVDEVHRWSKSQQDALLPHVERGTITLIAATTENPSFACVGALLSRCRVYQLRALTAGDIEGLLHRALADEERGLGKRRLVAADGAVAWLAAHVDGDARRALGALEAAASTLPLDGTITTDALADAMAMRVVGYDRDGIGALDVLSSFHKACRGSDPHAALYWLARGLQAGEDPNVFARRMAAIASEDVGLADSQALPLVMAAWEAFRRMGPAEGERSLAHAAVYLATAPKSNRLYDAWNAARAVAAETPSLPVPAHLLNSAMSTRHDPGRRVPYQYPFDHPDAFVAQPYQPSELQGRTYYHPGQYGDEKQIAKRLAWWAERGGPPLSSAE